MKSSPAVTAGEMAAFQGDVVGRDGAAAAARLVAGGEDRGQIRATKGTRLAAVDGGPAVASQHPGRSFAGRSIGSLARRARKRATVHRRRGARRRPWSWSSAR